MYLSFGVVVVLMVLLGVYGIHNLTSINDQATVISKEHVPRINLGHKINTIESDYRMLQYKHIRAQTRAEQILIEDELGKTAKDMEVLLQKYDVLVDKSNQALFEQIKEYWIKFLVEGKKIRAFSAANKDTEAMVLMVGESEKLFDDMSVGLAKLVETNEKNVDIANTSADITYESSIKLMIVILFLITVFSIIVAILMSRNITKSISEFLRISDTVAKGDLRDCAHIDDQDEFGQLAKSYNLTLTTLKTLILQIQNTAEQVAASSEELTAGADQSAQVSQQIAQNIGDVSGASDRQLQALERTTHAVEKISAGVKEISANVQSSSAQADQAVAKANDGTDSIEKAVQQMITIESTVSDSAKVVTTLGERSKEIGQIVETISGIAGQTNLLALNAAIEAARAGEMGKGFAVVAEEVRKLAEQSQEAAEKIAVLIADIQGETEKAVVAMGAGTQEVKKGTEVVSEAGAAFSEIARMAVAVSNQVKGISETMQEVAHETDDIVASVRKIDAASEEVSQEAQSVAAATEEQSASMQQIAASSKSLANLAQSLQAEARKFSV